MVDAVVVDGLSTQRDLRRVADLLEQGRASGRVSLDLSPLDRTGSSSVRLSATWGSILSNLLVAHAGDIELRVTLPRNPGVLLQLARAGLFFALAQHERCELVDPPTGVVEDLWRWREDWHPAGSAQISLFGDETSTTPVEVRSRFLAFINPDRSPMGTADAERANAIAPWLNTLTKRVLRDPIRREHLLSDVNMAVSELAENIVYHAKLIDRDGCYVFVYATKGPTGDSSNRLSIIAHDTGIGMDASMGDALRDEDVAARVVAPFNMLMPRYDRDRGRGLARIIAMAKHRGSAKLFAATSVEGDPSSAVLVTGSSQNDFRSRIVPGLPVKGTLVSVSFRLSFPTASRSEVRSAQREAARIRPTQMELTDLS